MTDDIGNDPDDDFGYNNDPKTRAARDALLAQLQLASRLPGFWRVHRFREARKVNGVEVPARWYYATNWRPGEPPSIAETLDELERVVLARVEAFPHLGEHPDRRSVMRELLSSELADLEVSDGRFLLPGTPP